MIIGRGGELARIAARVEAAAHGHGGVVLEAGEPGVGKSSLAAAAADTAATHGTRVRWGRCRETEGEAAYWPSTQRRLRFERTGPDAARDPAAAESGAYHATTGISVDGDGINHGEDVTVAARDALREMLDHLTTDRGSTRQRAYALCSVAVQLRISARPDVPDVCVTALLPLDVLDEPVAQPARNPGPRP